MSVAPQQNQQPQGRRVRSWASDTKISTYDQVSGALIAMLWLLGLVVLLLFMIWLTTLIRFEQRAVEVALVEPRGRGEAPEGIERDLEEPGVEELADVMEPQISETLEAVTDVVSSVSGTLEAMSGNAALMGSGSGKGDSRVSGPGGGGDGDVIPPWERWEIRYTTTSLNAYAEQLDFFNIELGLLGGGKSEVEYASNLTGAIRKRTEPNGKKENRLRFNYAPGPMQDMDMALVAKAGYDTKRRVPMQFYPPATEAMLTAAEQAKLGGKSIKDVRRTVFVVEGTPGNFRYVVKEILFRS